MTILYNCIALKSVDRPLSWSSERQSPDSEAPKLWYGELLTLSFPSFALFCFLSIFKFLPLARIPPWLDHLFEWVDLGIRFDRVSRYLPNWLMIFSLNWIDWSYWSLVLNGVCAYLSECVPILSSEQGFVRREMNVICFQKRRYACYY